MPRPIETQIDQTRCNGCGNCASICLDQAIVMEGDRPRTLGPHCLGCGHCAAVCPTGAITVPFVDPGALRFASLEVGDRYLPPGEFDPAALIQLMRSRRSCRHYLPKAVPGPVLEDLVRVGITAPSGTNCQSWTFTLLPDRPSVEALGDGAGRFFKKLNRMARNPALRGLSRIFLKDKLGSYFREYHDKVERALTEWEREGKDRLFHGATAAILVGMPPGASCPTEDALLASQNILLTAHAMGLGTCLIGFVVEAFRHDPSLKRLVGIPAEETVHAVIAVGYPAEPYKHPAGRRKVTPRYFRAGGQKEDRS
jgi:nitroreductase/NAD-dependent dihydropyrimidine dehydrogenase PreA subunit